MKYGLAVCVWFFVIVFIISCKQQKHRETFKDGSYNEGYAINDSLFNGIVKLYDSNGKYTGFLTYKSGIKNGLCVRYRLDGTTSDSFFYRNGEQFGNAYKFNKKGEMSNINFLSSK